MNFYRSTKRISSGSLILLLTFSSSGYHEFFYNVDVPTLGAFATNNTDVVESKESAGFEKETRSRFARSKKNQFSILNSKDEQNKSFDYIYKATELNNSQQEPLYEDAAYSSIDHNSIGPGLPDKEKDFETNNASDNLNLNNKKVDVESSLLAENSNGVAKLNEKFSKAPKPFDKISKAANIGTDFEKNSYEGAIGLEKKEKSVASPKELSKELKDSDLAYNPDNFDVADKFDYVKDNESGEDRKNSISSEQEQEGSELEMEKSSSADNEDFLKKVTSTYDYLDTNESDSSFPFQTVGKNTNLELLQQKSTSSSFHENKESQTADIDVSDSEKKKLENVNEPETLNSAKNVRLVTEGTPGKLSKNVNKVLPLEKSKTEAKGDAVSDSEKTKLENVNKPETLSSVENIESIIQRTNVEIEVGNHPLMLKEKEMEDIDSFISEYMENSLKNSPILGTNSDTIETEGKNTEIASVGTEDVLPDVNGNAINNVNAGASKLFKFDLGSTEKEKSGESKISWLQRWCKRLPLKKIAVTVAVAGVLIAVVFNKLFR